MCMLFATVLVLLLAPNLISTRDTRDVTDWEDYGSPPRRNFHDRTLFRVDTTTFGYDVTDREKAEEMKLCRENTSFSSGAFEGCMIGLSIGLVLGTIRAISLDGVPHAPDETPCKVLVGHVFGGILSGALIGIVHVFLTQCIFRVD